MKICISSGKGGVGKTTLTVNLAYALADRGKKVLVIDGDLGLANVDVMLGISATNTIQDILDKGADSKEAVVYLEPGLGILPASSGTPEMVTLGPEDQQVLEGYLQEVADGFDVVLMDTSAGIGPSVLWFNTFADHNLLVTTADPTSLTDAYALAKVLWKDYGRDLFRVVINGVRDGKEGVKAFETLAGAAKRFLGLEVDLLGIIPQDEQVMKSIREQVAFLKRAPDSNAARSIMELSEKVLSLL